MKQSYSVKQLVERVESGEKLKYLFFWGHIKSEEISKSCFSQWYDSSFKVGGELFKTAEHWMMAMKAELFDDTETRSKIMMSDTPKEAKNLGRKIKNFNSNLWDENKLVIVIAGNYHKFIQNEALFDFLVSTNGKIIAEASPVDRIWGIGMAQNHVNVKDPSFWNGENLLGIALMNVRDIFIRYGKPRLEKNIKLPPWKKYPEISRYSIGWRMGYGEEYFEVFLDYLSSLSESEKIALKMMYPALGDWKNWYDE
jgi:ribA/ribD-fused uncharacterized protein